MRPDGKVHAEKEINFTKLITLEMMADILPFNISRPMQIMDFEIGKPI